MEILLIQLIMSQDFMTNISSSEQILEALLEIYENNNQELSYIECLSLLIDETDLSEEDISKLLDSNTKSIIKINSANHGHFRKSFFQNITNQLDI